MSQQTKVVTGINTRLSYANIWEPKSINGGKEKYSVSLIIPKSDQKTVTAIEKAIDAAIQEGIGKFEVRSLIRPLSSYLFEMGMWNVMMLPTKIVTLSMLIRSQHHRLWTSMSNQSLIVMKFTVAAMPEYRLTSMLLTPTVTVELPVAWVTSKRSVMENH